MRILYIAFDNPAVDTILGGMNDVKDKLYTRDLYCRD